MMFGCISPAASAVTETIRTLTFANQVKGIQNKPTVQLDPREKLIQDLKNEIGRLREENERLKDLFAMSSPNSLRNKQLSLQMSASSPLISQSKGHPDNNNHDTHSEHYNINNNNNNTSNNNTSNNSDSALFLPRVIKSSSSEPSKLLHSKEYAPLKQPSSSFPPLKQPSSADMSVVESKTLLMGKKQKELTEEEKREEEMQLELEEALAQQLFDQLKF
jgi:hypothetical protein